MTEVNRQALLAALRSILMVGGASLGMFSTETLQEIVGAVLAVIGAAWAVWESYRAEASTKAREAVAVNVGIAVADRTVGLTPAVSPVNVPAVIEAFAPVAPTPDNDASPTGLAILPSSPVLPPPPKKEKVK